ncbi:hypothetical protein JCM11251_004154 [Rhodosporidiobolus azoricus]
MSPTPTSAEHKAAGNAAFAAKDMDKAVSCYSEALGMEKEDGEARAALLSNRSAAYLGLGQFDKALVDANNAVLARPKWSKAYARVAECYARQQDFQKAEQAYRQAISHAEDSAAKTRYEASLSITISARTKSSKNSEKKLMAGGHGDHWLHKLNRLCLTEGFVVDPNGGLALTIWAGQQCESGMQILDEVMRSKGPGGVVMGNPSSQAVPNICECILLDDFAFTLTPGRDPSFPLPEKFNGIYQFEIMAHGGTKYFTNAVWEPKDIIDDLNKRLATDGQERVRRLCSQMIRGSVLTAFGLGLKGEIGGSVTQCKFAIGLLEEGAKKWAHIAYEDKGMCFKPTFVRVVRVYLLKCLVRAARDAKTASARRMFSLESIEKLAKEIIAENKESEWAAPSEGMMRVGYNVMPHWEAYSALAFVYSDAARRPLLNVQPGVVTFADVENAKKAAAYYDMCCSFMPEDYHARPEMQWNGIMWHMRAGGLTVRELSKRIEETKRIDKLMATIFGNLPTDFEPRDFALYQHNSILQSSRGQPAGTIDTAIKAIPVLILKHGEEPSREIMAAWAPYPGNVAVADIHFK